MPVGAVIINFISCLGFFSPPVIIVDICIYQVVALVSAMNKKDPVMKTNRMPLEVLKTKRLCSGGEHWATSGIAFFKLEKLNDVILVNVCLSTFNRKGHRIRDMLPESKKVM